MKIENLETKPENRYATITIDADEVLDLINILYNSDYFDAEYNHRKTECCYLYYQLQVLYDLMHYGRLTDHTFDKHNRFLELKNKKDKKGKDNG